MNIYRGILFICLILSNQFAIAGKLEKGFERLAMYDYFGAKEYFEKTLDDETPAAAFGLSKIYSTEKNPFYSPDSARRYILIADSTFKTLKDRKKRYYAEFGVTDSSISNLSEFICDDAYTRAQNENSVERYNHFLRNFTSCALYSDATALRNTAAFNEARSRNSSVAYKEFMALYPRSEQYGQAMSKYEERIFDENTSDHSIEAYEFFLQNYPENPYRPQAEKMIFNLSIPDKTLDQYLVYARKYKNMRYASDAWREVYRLSMKDFSEESFSKFKTQYPDYPFAEELETDFRLQNYYFLPFENEEKWGYINELGQEMIKPIYEEASLFSEGLAAVFKNNKYGYINKSGKVVVDFKFKDAEAFHHGAAVVMADSMYGLINRSGDFLIKPQFEELSEAAEDIYVGVKEEGSGYIHKNGQQLTRFMFDLSNDFNNGYAVVSKDEKFGLLNAGGFFNIEPKYEELVFIGSNLLKAKTSDELWGIVNVQGEIILPFLYDAIGEFSENRVLIAKDEKCGYADEKGNVVIPLIYRFTSIMMTTGQFKSGFAMLKQKVKSIIIDTTGKVLSFPAYEDYGLPSQGLMPVKKYKKWGYADMTGKIKIPNRYESAEPFNNGYGIIRLNKMTGAVDTSGVIFIQALYEDISIMEKAIVVRNNGKSGLLSTSGILLVPCSYDKIEFLNSSLSRATNSDGFTYINLENGKIIYKSESQ